MLYRGFVVDVRDEGAGVWQAYISKRDGSSVLCQGYSAPRFGAGRCRDKDRAVTLAIGVIDGRGVT